MTSVFSSIRATPRLLTRSGRMVAVGALGAIGIGAAGGIIELVALGVIGLALVVLCLAWVGLRRPDLDVQRRVSPARSEVGTHTNVELRLTNRGRRVSPVATIHDPVSSTVGAHLWLGSLRPGAAATAVYRLPTDHRGRFEIGPLAVTVTDPFGLTVRVREVAEASYATVLPHIDTFSAHLAGEGLDDRSGPPRADLGGHGSEFAGLRPYVRGDDLRRVHWRSSARTSADLLVRQDEPPAAGLVTVLADVRASRAGPAAQEHVISAAASILSACSARGDAVRLVSSAGADSPADVGPRHLDRLLDRLAVLEPQFTRSLAPAVAALTQRRCDALVVITAGMDGSDLVTLAGLARRATLVRFEPSSWPDGVGRGLPIEWDPNEPGPSDDQLSAPVPRGFRSVVRVTAANTFATAWRSAR